MAHDDIAAASGTLERQRAHSVVWPTLCVAVRRSSFTVVSAAAANGTSDAIDGARRSTSSGLVGAQHNSSQRAHTFNTAQLPTATVAHRCVRCGVHGAHSLSFLLSLLQGIALSLECEEVLFEQKSEYQVTHQTTPRRPSLALLCAAVLCCLSFLSPPFSD